VFALILPNKMHAALVFCFKAKAKVAQCIKRLCGSSYFTCTFFKCQTSHCSNNTTGKL